MRSKSAGLDFWSNVEVLLYPSFSSGITGLDLKRLQKRALLNHISARPNRNFFRALRTLRDDAHAVRRKQGLADRCLKADCCTFLQIPAVFRFGGQLGVPKLWRHTKNNTPIFTIPRVMTCSTVPSDHVDMCRLRGALLKKALLL